jgi:hypothetical protein
MIPYGLIVYTQYLDGTIEASERQGGSGFPTIEIPYGGSDSHERAALALVRKIHGSTEGWQIVARADNPSGFGLAFVFVQGAVREAA